MCVACGQARMIRCSRWTRSGSVACAGEEVTGLAGLQRVLAQLVTGMNEVTATLSHVVTRGDLRALAAAQSAETQAMFRPLRPDEELAGAYAALCSLRLIASVNGHSAPTL